MGPDADPRSKDACHGGEKDASRGQVNAEASAATLVAADDGRVQPLLDQLSPQMALASSTLSGRSISVVAPSSSPMASLGSGGLIDIPAAPDVDLPSTERPNARELHATNSGPKVNSALSPGTQAKLQNRLSSQGQGADRNASSPDITSLVAASLAQLPSPAPLTRNDSQQASAQILQPQYLPGSYDWPTFVVAYAAGRWNPHRIPSAPQPTVYSTPATPGILAFKSKGSTGSEKGSSNTSTTTVEPFTLSTSTPHLSPQPPSGPGTGTDSSTSVSDISGLSHVTSSSAPTSASSKAGSPAQPGASAKPTVESIPVSQESPPDLSASLPPEISPLTGMSHRRASIGSSSPRGSNMRIPLPPPSITGGSGNTPLHIRNALFSPSSHPHAPQLQPLVPLVATPGSESVYFSAASTMPSGPTTPDLTTAAATMRWAASSHPSLAPLAIPSPEHELTDPMRGMTVSMPVDEMNDTEEEGSSDNGNGSRKWSGLGIRAGKTRRRGYYTRGKTASQTRRIWEKFIGGETHQSSSEDTEVGKSDDETLHLPSEPIHSRRHEGRTVSTASLLPTIEASPLGSPAREVPNERFPSREEHAVSASAIPEDSHRAHSTSRSSSVPAPSSQPLLRSASDEDSKSPFAYQTDYFGLAVRNDTQTMASSMCPASMPAAESKKEDVSSTQLDLVPEREFDPSSQSVSSVPLSSSSQTSETSRLSDPPSSSLQISRPSLQTPASLSLPATPMHRDILNRQSSSPLPARSGSVDDGEVDEGTPLAEPTPATTVPGRRATFDTSKLRLGMSISVGAKAKISDRPGLSRAQSMKAMGSGHVSMRLTREEEEYLDKGYLVPPFPRDEAERRRALRKFNIVHTMPDVNFDRIAYLTKLVFSTKIVVVSLIDEDEEWFKMESGMGMQTLPRDISFSAHAILQRGDEPTVVLDTRRDWRFSMNPLVVERPYVRFFASAPLRTSEGHNVGSLCVMDDQPHSEFTPRQRHTLKEFSAIVMREMELWKDKIQLRIRDRIQTSMEQFTRECLEIDVEDTASTHGVLKAGSMDRVYDRAAKLVRKTLDVEGATVMDVSLFDVLETTKAEGAISIVCHHGDCVGEGQAAITTTTTHSIPTDEYQSFMEFFSKYPEGKVAEGIIPKCFRSMLPTRIQHALIVPIFNIDKRPFALLCAYNTADHVKPFLEGHELSYLRAIGVIILSAVLKRRMILADKSKSLFISNISHELRTPLHGILAAAELLADTELDDNQSSFLRTVQACGTSLVETVNHVLDFTKLSGNSKNGGVENVIHPSKVDLMQLVEEAVEGCWIGHRARLPASSEIGSVYAPPLSGSQFSITRTPVEVVIEVGLRNEGWQLICEKGGIRRVLMNLIGNSLKFTSNGYVHVLLRELPNAIDTPSGKVKIELAVVDTGKGISKEFLKNQLFHPFSQENPLQSGTGLGLAIVNSIIRSESVNGQVEVSSTEGVGTDIRITFDADVPEDEQPSEIEKLEMQGRQPTVSMIGFDDGSKGTALLREVLLKYLEHWWGFQIVPTADGALGDILVLNEDTKLISHATAARDTSRPFVLLTSSRADAETMATVYDFERLGGFVRLVSKPGGPSRLRQVLRACVHIIHFKESAQRSVSPEPQRSSTSPPAGLPSELIPGQTGILRNTSQQSGESTPLRPRMTPRANTFHPVLSKRISIPTPKVSPPQEYPSSPGDTTITIGAGGTLLKSSVGTWSRQGNNRTRVLVVEDNQILRDLLSRWLRNKGYDLQHATDGREGVDAFKKTDHIDIVLVDLSMPVLDGISATAEIREIEAKRLLEHARSQMGTEPPRPVKILALTGMSSLEDKRRAFEAGVDGYLVKPVAFKTLDAMFHQLGVS
ncbi:hypothetical protein ACEPAF_8113 [Sanghuangporus sanghuang]